MFFKNLATVVSRQFDCMKRSFRQLQKTDFYKRTDWDGMLGSCLLLLFFFPFLIATVDIWGPPLYAWVNYRHADFDECILVLAITIPCAIALYGIRCMERPIAIHPVVLYFCMAIIIALLYGFFDGQSYPRIFALRSLLVVWLVDVGVTKTIPFLASFVRNIRRKLFP